MFEFFRKLLPLLSDHARKRMLLAALVMVVIVILEGVGLVLLASLLQLLTSEDFSANSGAIEVVSDVLGASGGSLAGVLASIVVAIYTIKGIMALVVNRRIARLAANEEVRMARRLLLAYLRAPYEVHLERNSAEFQRTLTASLRTIFGSPFVTAFTAIADLISIFVVGVVLVVADPLVAAFAITYFGTVGFLYQRRVHKPIKAASKAAHGNQARVLRLVQQALTAIKEVKVRGVESNITAEVDSVRSTIARAHARMAVSFTEPRYIMEMALVGGAALVAGLAFATRSSTDAIASLGLFLAGAFRLLTPLNKLVNATSQTRAALPGIAEIDKDLRELGTFVGDDDTDVEAVEINDKLECRAVSYSYRSGVPVLAGVDLTVDAGESVAVVGGSGAGKTTLADIILGVLQPDSGEVLVDGVPLAEVGRRWQQTVGYVPQVITLFDDDIRSNVALGVPRDKIDDERIAEVLRIAQLTDVVAALPEGLDTIVGEAGVRLSGGQRQRLGIARALYHRPKLLVLDEATSALDNETEARVGEVLGEALRGLSSITIAHRLSTIRDADRVYYMEAGRVVDSGKFIELQERVPNFAKLVALSSMSRTETTAS